MKKLIFLLLIAVISISLISCNGSSDIEDDGSVLSHITIINGDFSIDVGTTTFIEVQALPETALDDLRFKCSDESILTIDKKTGEITAISEGVVTVTAYSKENSDVKATCQVTVTPHVHMSDNNPVRENIVESTCAKAGSYDEVTYCVYTNCKQEATRETKVLKKEYHDYVDYVCTECGQVASKGLEYQLSEDGDYYSVTGLGTCTDIDVVIPDRYNDIEVRCVYKIAREGSHIQSFTIPATVVYFEADYNFTDNVREIIVEESNEAYMSREGILYSADMTRIIACPPRYATASYEVPETVKIIGSYAFSGSTIPHFYIHENVEEIGNGAFSSSLIESIVIDCKVDRIFSYTFGSCYNLTSVTLGKNINTIDDDAFFYCTNLVEVINKSSLNLTKGSEDHGRVALYAKSIVKSEPEKSIVDDNIEGFLFVSDGGVNYLIHAQNSVLPDTYKGEPYVITKDAFANMPKIASITIGSGVSYIEEGAFSHFLLVPEVINRSAINIVNYYEEGSYYVNAIVVHSGESKIIYDNIGCFLTDNYGTVYLADASGIITKDIVLPDYFNGQPYEIAQYAFYGNKSIESVVIGSGVTKIGFDAFSQCSSLKSITIKEGVDIIEAFAFSGCAFEEIDIPNSVTLIGDSAFGYNKRLKSVYIGEGVSEIYNPFEGCSNLKLITVTALNPYLKTVDNVLYTSDFKTLLCYPAGKVDARFVIPEGVEIIESKAFYMASNLKHVIISDTVKSIKSSAFYQCVNIETLVFGSALEEIRSWAFYDVDPHSILWKSQQASLGMSVFSYFGDTNVYFTGTEEEWNAFVASNSNNNDYIHYVTVFFNQTQLP